MSETQAVPVPPAFAEGLGPWSRVDGLPGQATYQGAADATLVPADQDFGTCLELYKTETVQRLRWTGAVPVEPGRYLRVAARVRQVGGPLCGLRIGAWAGAGGVAVPGQPLAGPAVALTDYGRVATVAAILGTGARGGVDLVWDETVTEARVGLDLTGPDGAILRIESVTIEDVTAMFVPELFDWVDVRDYGARGNGVDDDADAFAAANRAAGGRLTILVPPGVYRLGRSLTLDAPVRFSGTVTMAAETPLLLIRGFDLPTYAAAFGSEVEGFRRAFQALMAFADHDSLDLRGRRIEIDRPIDMQAALATSDSWEIRRVIRNGVIHALNGPDWEPGVVTSSARYDRTAPRQLSQVAGVAAIERGALVTGYGVGREVYVTGVDPATATVTLSQPLWGATPVQDYTFTRFRYLLDFSGFSKLSRLNFDDVELQCNGLASGLMLPRDGNMNQLRDCYVIKPRHRGVTSIGTGCQDLHIDRCQFISNEMSLRAQDRQSVAFNVNANDAKIRDNRFMRFGTTGVLAGNGHLLIGNHWFQGDNETEGLRSAGLVLTEPNVKGTLTGNYIDNSFIEWTNEYDAMPIFSGDHSFGGLTITGNIFTVNDVADWFSWIVIRPFGHGHHIRGLSITNNAFKSLNGRITRVDRVDSTVSALDYLSMRNVVMTGNSYTNVETPCANPLHIEHVQAGVSQSWLVETDSRLPFGGLARNVTALVAEGMITGPAGERRTDMPYVLVQKGPGGAGVSVNWEQPSKGRVMAVIRMDNPD